MHMAAKSPGKQYITFTSFNQSGQKLFPPFSLKKAIIVKDEMERGKKMLRFFICYFVHGLILNLQHTDSNEDEKTGFFTCLLERRIQSCMPCRKGGQKESLNGQGQM